MANSSLSKILWRKLGYQVVAGTDEVGRGCLAGPVYAAAVVLCPTKRIKGLTDSKLIEKERRHELAIQIKEVALHWSIAWASVEEIERLNILQASLLAMRRAVEALKSEPEIVLIDGNKLIGGHWKQQAFINGDLRCEPISAASIIAKVARDLHMDELDERYPGYGFAKHKGYGTPQHREAIIKLGPCELHRKTFGMVREHFESLQVSNWSPE